MPSRPCNGCTLCCTLLEVKPLGKPANTECPNCTSSGCGVWDLRPAICRRFVCLWYANPKFPDSLRPDRCGVVFEPGGERVMLAMVDQERPAAWQQGIANGLIAKFAADGTAVIVQVGTTKHFVLPKGDTIDAVWERVTSGARVRDIETQRRMAG